MSLIFDAVHGTIQIDKQDLQFIDNRWMKRLKRIKQLGLLDHVFISGSHGRFEHVLGVYHIADEYTKLLDPNKKFFTEKERRCIKLAGLFHDLGHGPYSHIFDNYLENFSFEQYPKLIKKHEVRSQLIVEEIFRELQPSGFTGYDIELIKNMIEPPDSMIKYENEMKIYNCEKPYLYEIVNNKLNGLDVDRFDYLQRDSKHIGLNYSFNPDRILYKSFIHPELKRIVYDISIKNNIYDLYYTRFKFHKEIYNHKTVKIIELMLRDALDLINNCQNCPNSKFADLCSLTSDNRINEDYLYLDDSIYNTYLRKSEYENRKAACTLINRIENRNLYKLIYNNQDINKIIYEKLKFSLTNTDNVLHNVIFHDKYKNMLCKEYIENRTELVEYSYIKN
jgi:deoxynucleoside triphosphate triphosphohydrolase SAMHD1